MWLGCSSSEMIWEFWRNRNRAESTVAYCEEKANVMFGCVNSNRSSGVQEIVCPSAQRERDLNGRNAVPGLGSVSSERYGSAGEHPVRTMRILMELRKHDPWGWVNWGSTFKKCVCGGGLERDNMSCWDISYYRESKNSLFPMTVIARTEDIYSRIDLI